jgi:putative peptide zinc metalloprotease protein
VTASTATVAPPAAEPAGRRPDAVPERARDVQLLGEFAGSGYRETPTLVRRGDGQLIKLTPLLYELVDAIDGRRGSEELAAELGRRVGKQATADDVRFLVEHKLRPLGVLRQPDGSEPEVQRSNPLLALRPRFVVSRPELTRRLTAPFVWLFSPIVAVPVVLAFAAITSWLLFDKGLSSALHQAFYEPGLILAIWALVIASAAFHEIGHAAACRSAGAKPGAIGAGLYLIWPAFYTDVTNAYRLSRRDRLRVDLGGLYFSAIFAVASAGLWALTGADALLLVIAIQLFQMVRQLVPFIRADGYHIVADLVGVPDLFAHLKPTLLGMLPTRWGRRQQKRLKPWARGVITGWVALTVPALLLMLGFIVLTFPRIAATAWDSLGLRWAETTTYWSAGDVAGVAMSGIAMGLIALPVLAITYFLTYLGRRLALRAWRDTAGRPGRRALVALGGAGLVALIAWAWWPGDKYRPIDPDEGGPAPTILLPAAPSDSVQTVQLSATVTPSPGPLATPEAVAIIRAILLSPHLLPDSALAPSVPGAPDVPGLPDAPEAPDPGPIEAPEDPNAPETIQGSETDGAAGSMEPTPPPTGTDPNEPAWPFPFDPPEPAGPGDNRAMAVNTTDGSTLWDFAFSLLLLEAGDPVHHANEAFALAHCTNCLTLAVAFQVILIVDYVEEIIPVNRALALNYACETCNTYAFAYQIIASISEAPSPEVQGELELAFQLLRALEAEAGSLTALEIYLVLEEVKQRTLNALEGVLAVETAESAPGVSEEASQLDDETGTSQTNEDSGTASQDSGAGLDGAEAEDGAAEVESETTPADEPDSDSATSEDAASGEATTTCVEAEETTAEECPDEDELTEGPDGSSTEAP